MSDYGEDEAIAWQAEGEPDIYACGIDDVDAPPLTDKQRDRLAVWWEQVRLNPNLVVRMYVWEGGSLTSIRQRDIAAAYVERTP